MRTKREFRKIQKEVRISFKVSSESKCKNTGEQRKKKNADFFFVVEGA